MSESPKCGCGKKHSACSSPAKSESTASTSSESGSSSTASSSSTSAKSATGIQNGKGDAPRNISPRFRKNFDDIRWDSAKKAKRQEGVKFVKVY